MNDIRILAAVVLIAASTPCAGATPMTAAGESHALALHGDGTIRAWGNDAQGQLGIGTVLASRDPKLIAGLPPIRASRGSVAGGYNHAYAIAADGAAWAWGWNNGGVLGDGTTTGRSAPVRVANLTDVAGIAGGNSHGIAFTSNGEVWSWGANLSGALGAPEVQGRRTRPGRVAISTAAAVAAGFEHSLVLDRDGTVWAFGANAVGQLGDGSTTQRRAPVRVQGLADVVAIAAGAYYSLAVRGDGSVWAWGLNDYGQLGDGSTANRATPVRVLDVSGIVGIAAGKEFTPQSFAVGSDGRVWRWGAGAGVSAPVTGPLLLEGYGSVRHLESGSDFSVALRADGSVWTGGPTASEVLGRSGASAPAEVPGLAGAVAVAAGSNFAVAVLADGRAFAWGGNANGTLGLGTPQNRTTPAFVANIIDVTQVAAGGTSYALRANGTVASWGGVAGAGPSIPALVEGLDAIVQIAAGTQHGIALRADGTVWTWGFNDFGQLGHSPLGDVVARGTQVPGLGGAVRVAAAGTRSMVVLGDGSVWAWGRNDDNTMGVAPTAQCTSRTSVTPVACTPQPTRIAGIDSVVDLAISPSHALAIRADRGLWAWGNNFVGALGDDTTGGVRPTPAPVLGISGVRAVAALGTGANATSIALTADGSVWTWGDGSRGQLGGEGSGRTPQGAMFRPRPGRIDGLGSITHIAAGGQHALAVRADGVVFGWGANFLGQVGDGTLADRSTPVVVVRENGAGSIEGGDWFLDLDPAAGAPVAADKAFALVATGSIGTTEADVAAQFRYRAADVGSSGAVFVFALAPASTVQGAASMKSAHIPGIFAKASGKETPVACVLAQLNASGQLVAVSAAAMQAYVSGVFSAQGQAVGILNGVPVVNIGGATFFVGYGSSGTAMIDSGTNRSVASIPGALECRPQAPKTGWWWDPPPTAGARSPRDGTGYSIEAQGSLLFFAAFLYDASGRATWYVASGRTSLDGSLFVGELLQARGGQSLGGAYRPFSSTSNAGPITLAFNSATSGTMVWAGGTVPLGRFDIVPNGAAAAPRPNTPESGWWWNPAESGRGFFIEWQDGWADLAGYMYDDAGNPVWYITVVQTPNPLQLSGTWLSFGNGMSLTGAWRPHQLVNSNVAPVTIDFTSATTAVMTLPGGRTTNLVRHRF